MKICAITHETIWKNPQQNSLEQERHIQKALALHPATQTILFPETSFTGFVLDDDNQKLAETSDGYCVSETRRLAQKYNINLICGFIEKSAEAKPYNALAVAGRDGSLKGIYRKQHLFTLSAEPQIYSRGDYALICELDGWRCGFFICFDIRFPRLFEAYKTAGAECLFGAFNWVQGRNKADMFDSLIKARAAETRLFIAAVDRSGKDPNTGYTEKCCLANPYGENGTTTAQPPYYFAEFDKKDNETVEKMFPLATSFRAEYRILNNSR